MFAARSGVAALSLLSLKAIALAIPLAIGGAIAALFLLIEDFIVFMQGGDSPHWLTRRQLRKRRTCLYEVVRQL